MNKYEVWMDGYLDQGTEGIPAKAHRLTRKGEQTLWDGETFQEACLSAMRALDWPEEEIKKWYNPEKNSFSLCVFYDNEEDARKSYG
jgi:hypothetical protein